MAKTISEQAWDVHEKITEIGAAREAEFAPELDPDTDIVDILRTFIENDGDVDDTMDIVREKYEDSASDEELEYLEEILADVDFQEIDDD
jgi:hypothetical protein